MLTGTAYYFDPEHVELRQQVLRAIAEGGHEQVGPTRNGVIVAVAKVNDSTVGGVADLDARLAPFGLHPETRDEWTLFPIGSDGPPERLRHMPRYSVDRPTHWLYRPYFFVPTEACL